MRNVPHIKLALAALVAIVLCMVLGVMLKSLVNNADGPVKGAVVVSPPAGNWTERQFIEIADPSSPNSGYLTSSRAMELARSDTAASSWFSGHEKWGLENIQANQMSANGLAYEWMITYISGNDVMMVDILGGKRVSCIASTSSSSVIQGMSPDGLLDSSVIMGYLMGNSSGLRVDNTSSPFSLYLRPGSNASYVVRYADLNNDGSSFSAILDARSGELLENTYRGVIL